MNRRLAHRLSSLVGVSVGCALALGACAGPSQPPSGGGPQAVINSPSEGSLTAGTFFFSVQPLDPSQVASVSFSAGGATLGTDQDATDGFRTFVAAADHGAGQLVLEAIVRGKDGRTTTLRRNVTNVPQPPSSATVGAGGAALGTVEDNGSLSAIIVPPGSATGASVSFTAMTQAEVKSDTGVDYDALGITFLGAQDIETSAEFSRTPGVSSGGFGPAVQPEQAVVNYMIGPDADGDGVGELYVVNTASVAPNGDVVSDPVPVAQVGSTATLTTAGSSRLSPLATGLRAAPGTVLELPVAGFNPASLRGNLAVFRVGSQLVERHARVEVSPAGAQTLVVLMPPLDPGSGTLTLHNVGSGYVADPIDITVAAPSPVSGSPGARIDATLDLALEVLEALDQRLAGTGQDQAVPMGLPFLQQVRTNVAAIESGGRPEDAQALAELAARFEASGIDALLGSLLTQLNASGRLVAAQGKCNDILDRADRGMEMIGDFTDLAGYDAPGGDAVGSMQDYAISEWWGWVKKTMLTIDEQLGGDACRPPPPGPSGPGGRATPSGMGAAVPAGGNVGGNAGPPNFRPITDYSLGMRPQATGLERGRFHVSISVAGSPIPFKGTTDASGYFMVPLVPVGEPFTAVALDTETGENRVATGIGPAAGEGFYLVFDFSVGESEYTVSTWDGEAGDGKWLTPTNWDDDSLPLPNSDVVIPAGSGMVDLGNASGESYKVAVHSVSVGAGSTLQLSRGTLELLGDSSVDGELLLTNGTIQPLADVVIDGQMTWNAGALSGTGSLVNRGTVTLNANAGLNPRTLRGLLVNEGTVVLQGTQASGLRTEVGGSVVNAAGGVFEVHGVPGVQTGGGVGLSTFANHGTIVKSSGEGVSHWTGAEVNHLGGTVVVEAGTLLLSEGTASTGGTWQVSSGAALELGSHTRVLTFSGAYTGDGPGVVRLAGGERYEMAPAGATFDFPDGSLEWVRSSVSGPGSFVNLGSLHIVNSTFSPALHGTLENHGAVVLRGTANKAFQNGSGATIRNLAGATFEVRDDQGIGNATPPLTFSNAGSLTKVGGEGASTMWVCLVDEGGTVIGDFDFRDPSGCE